MYRHLGQYTDGITSDNIIDAITTFERSLYTPNSHDQYLRGAPCLTAEALDGYSL
jgi:cytochrome c peroxidase